MTFIEAVAIIGVIASSIGTATGLILLGVRLGRLSGNNLDAAARIVVRGDIRNEAMIASALAFEMFITMSVSRMVFGAGLGPGSYQRAIANCVITLILCVNQALNYRDYRAIMAIIDRDEVHG